MLIPIRCFSCGFPIATLAEQYEKAVKAGKDPEKVLDKLGVERYCCRRMFISKVDLIEEIARFKRG